MNATGSLAYFLRVCASRGAIFHDRFNTRHREANMVCRRLPLAICMSAEDIGGQGGSAHEASPPSEKATRNVGVHPKMKLFQYSWSQRFSGKGKVFQLADKKVSAQPRALCVACVA
jgi:hypothetical protein